MPLPLQGLDLEQYVKMEAAKMRYLNVLILRITFSLVQSSALLHGILKLRWNLLTDLKQANKLAPASMDIETSLAQQYHKMGMKCSPATRPDCLFWDGVGAAPREGFSSPTCSRCSVSAAILLLASVIFPSHGIVLP